MLITFPRIQYKYLVSSTKKEVEVMLEDSGLALFSVGNSLSCFGTFFVTSMKNTKFSLCL